MRAVATSEKPVLEARSAMRLEQDIKLGLIPKDAMDDKNVILEIRAGTGGDEAALFAGNLFRMYERYAAKHGWKTEILSESEGTKGGFKEIIAEIAGRGAFSRLEIRIRRPSRPTRARYRGFGPHPHFGSNGRGSAGGGGRRRRYRRYRPTDRNHAVAAGPAASTSTKPSRRYASPICRPASW